MFFTASKLLTHFERPGEFLLLSLLLGLGLAWTGRYRRPGLMMATAAALALLCIAIFPVASWVAAPLEERFPRPRLPDYVDGVIVLGGAVDPITTVRRGIPTLNSEAERMTEFVWLARRYPEARLVFSGGASRFRVDPKETEAGVALLFFQQQGVDLRRVMFEGRSRNTYENVINSKRLVKPRRGETWLLVASAKDVPRCIGVFRQQGWTVIPVPVAYKSDLSNTKNFAFNLRLLDDAAHEWIGLVAYRLTGKTKALFPGPEAP